MTFDYNVTTCGVLHVFLTFSRIDILLKIFIPLPLSYHSIRGHTISAHAVYWPYYPLWTHVARIWLPPPLGAHLDYIVKTIFKNAKSNNVYHCLKTPEFGLPRRQKLGFARTIPSGFLEV